VNRFIRTASTSRLVAVIAGVAIAIAGGATIAIAAQGGGPVPPRKPLAVAIHQALTAPAVSGVSGTFSFTDNLLPSSEIQGSDPLLSGGGGRFWLAGDALRLELQGDNGDVNAVVRDGSFWAYDPSTDTVYEGRLPASGSSTGARRRAQKREQVPTVTQIRTALAHLAAHVRLSGAIPSDVAGRPAYTVRVSPRAGGGMLGAIAVAFDALRGVPLRFALYARGDSTPVLAVQATGIHYGRVAKSVFAISPPRGAHIVHVFLASTQSAPPGSHARRRERGAVSGVSAVARHLAFPLLAPARLGGLSRSSVSLLGSDTALVLYGRPLGGVAVIERPAARGVVKPVTASQAGGGQPGLTVPTVTVDGTRAQELDTLLGTVLWFARGGVQYTVLGSVKPAVVVAVARSL
jgi:outer membrane lipoprotein-sorting protein